MESDSLKEELSFHYAGFKKRMFAFLIDISICIGLAWLIWGSDIINTSGDAFQISMHNEQMLIPAFYFLLFWAVWSTSAGKYLLKLRIIDKQGNKITYWQALIRTLSYCLLIAGVWLMLTNKEKVTLHDLLASTRVISNN